MKKYFLQILILILFLLSTACTSSSSSVRYGKVESPKESKQNSVRFTSLENEEEDDLDEFDEKPPVVNPELKNKLKEEINRYSDFTPQITEREKLLFEIIKYIDTPYKYGGIQHLRKMYFLIRLRLICREQQISNLKLVIKFKMKMN